MRRLLLALMCIPLLAAADDGRRIIDAWMVRAPFGPGFGPGILITKAFTVERPWALRWKARGRFQVDLLDGNGNLVEQLALQNEGGLGSSRETRVGTFVLRFQYTAPWGAEVSVAADPPSASPWCTQRQPFKGRGGSLAPSFGAAILNCFLYLGPFFGWLFFACQGFSCRSLACCTPGPWSAVLRLIRLEGFGPARCR